MTDVWTLYLPGAETTPMLRLASRRGCMLFCPARGTPPPAALLGLVALVLALAPAALSDSAGSKLAEEPELYFTVAPLAGPADLTVCAAVHTVDGRPLPDGTCLWAFDDELESGPMSTHAQVRHTFLSPGLHWVRVSVVVAGLTFDVSCAPRAGGPSEKVQVVLWPTISGRVLTPTGQPVGDVRVSGEGVEDSATTDAEGCYALAVPYGWSGRVFAAHAGYEFDPVGMSLADVTDHVTGVDFVAIQQPLTPTVEPQDRFGRGAPGSVQSAVNGYRLGGRVADHAGRPHAGVRLLFTGSGSWQGEDFAATTGQDGTYVQRVPPGWSGTVSSDWNHRLEPPLRTYSHVHAPQEAQDFAGFNNYYVATGGSDAGPGTIEAPYATLGRAAARVEPGDTIYLRGGTHVARFIRFAASGTPAEPITVRGYPGEEAVLTSNSPAHWVFDFTETYSSAMRGFGYFVFRGLRLHSARVGWFFDFPGIEPKNHHITIEDVEGWNCEALVKTRRAGVQDLTIRRCDFHHATGTEGAIDLGNNMDAVDTPHAASRAVVVEDTDLHDNNINQQCNGIVTQGNTANVMLRRCRAWNNGKYGFALKGSGATHVDRCTAWGNRSTQLYLRGMVSTDPPERTEDAYHDMLVTNTVLIGTPDNLGAVLDWREHANIRVYNCTVVALRDESKTNAGWALANGERHQPPHLAIKADIRNTTFLTWDGTVVFFNQASGLPFWRMRRYEADHNLFYKLGNGSPTKFHYQKSLWQQLSQWQDYWARGEPDGDDELKGPRATRADAHSVWTDPQFVRVPQDIGGVPDHWQWPPDYRVIIDVTPRDGSPALGAGENLRELGIPELMVDYNGDPRPAKGNWTIGAIR